MAAANLRAGGRTYRISWYVGLCARVETPSEYGRGRGVVVGVCGDWRVRGHIVLCALAGMRGCMGTGHTARMIWECVGIRGAHGLASGDRCEPTLKHC